MRDQRLVRIARRAPRHAEFIELTVEEHDGYVRLVTSSDDGCDVRINPEGPLADGEIEVLFHYDGPEPGEVRRMYFSYPDIDLSGVPLGLGPEENIAFTICNQL